MSLGGSELADSATAPSRHDLLVDPVAWPAVVVTRGAAPKLPPVGEALVWRWADSGWPIIARRPSPNDALGAVPVGLPLPPGVGKARVSLSVSACISWRALPLVTLTEAASVLADGGVETAEWRDEAVRLHAAFVERSLSPGGSADLLAATLLLDALEAKP